MVRAGSPVGFEAEEVLFMHLDWRLAPPRSTVLGGSCSTGYAMKQSSPSAAT